MHFLTLPIPNSANLGDAQETHSGTGLTVLPRMLPKVRNQVHVETCPHTLIAALFLTPPPNWKHPTRPPVASETGK